MSKRSRRPNREEIKEHRREKKRQQKLLRAMQKTLGLVPKPHGTTPDTVSSYETTEEEKKGRVEATTGQMSIIKAQLPSLLKRLDKIPDPRNPKKTKHRLTLLMLYGILMFVFQMSSRREANRDMTNPQIEENLRMIFPELIDIPHAVTLFRLLKRIDVNQIEDALIEMIKRLIKKKKFRRYLINNCYPIAIDGTQKMPFNTLWCPELLERKLRNGASDDADVEKEDKHQYYVYVLEANLSFKNGMVIPLLSEFLEFEQGDIENNKQDCEQRAFSRLAERLKAHFPRLPILLLLDGLYANGPIMELCNSYSWQFMIVLKEDSLPTVWEEFNSLLKLLPENKHWRAWRERHQQFKWVNKIDYYFDGKKIAINVVICDEDWEIVDKDNDIVPQKSRHAWISSRPLNRDNLHPRCNLGARYRWGIEICFLVEKHQGYQYEHCFAFDWQAMKGYHYLMRLGHTFNTLARFSKKLSKLFRLRGVRGFIKFVYITLTGSWLQPEDVEAFNLPFQLRLE